MAYSKLFVHHVYINHHFVVFPLLGKAGILMANHMYLDYYAVIYKFQVTVFFIYKFIYRKRINYVHIVAMCAFLLSINYGFIFDYPLIKCFYSFLLTHLTNSTLSFRSGDR